VAITEDSRHQLYQRLEHVMGRPQATTLMEHLPPVGWADVATKRDLEHVHASIDHVREVLSLKIDAEIATLRGDMHKEIRSLAFTVIAAYVSVSGLAVAAVAALR
jgi:hypothetical protein